MIKNWYVTVREIIAIELNSGSDVRELLIAVRQKKIIIAKLNSKFKVSSFLIRLISHIKKLKAKILELGNYTYLVIVPDDVKIEIRGRSSKLQ